MYEPHAFTHQGLDGEDDFLSGLPWPAAMGTREAVVRHLLARMGEAGLDTAQQAQKLNLALGKIAEYFENDWGEAQLSARFDEAEQWAHTHGIPLNRLFMGEFAASLMSSDGSRGAFEADRSRYVEAVLRKRSNAASPGPFGSSPIRTACRSSKETAGGAGFGPAVCSGLDDPR